MANTSRRKGFKVLNQDNNKLRSMVLKASFTNLDGDVAYLGSDGYPTTRNSAYPIIGCQVGSVMDKDDLTVKTTSGDGDFVVVTDPREDHVGEIATGARTDPFTTFTASAAFDVDGAAGAKYIDNTASTYDEVQVLGPAREEDGNGALSAYGTNQKVIFRFNAAKIMPVHSNYNQTQ